jgi:hypothetical protein
METHTRDALPPAREGQVNAPAAKLRSGRLACLREPSDGQGVQAQVD